MADYLGWMQAADQEALNSVEKLNLNLVECVVEQIPQLINLKELSFWTEYESDIPEQFYELNLNTLGLSGVPFNPRIIQLTNLTFLQFSCGLTSVPLEICKLTNLVELDLSSNEITHLPVEVNDLVNLKALDISYNQLRTCSLRLPNLKDFAAHYNRINSLSLGSAVLISVFLPFNELTNIDQLSQVPIESLDVSRNRLSHIPALPFVKHLYIFQNKITKMYYNYNFTRIQWSENPIYEKAKCNEPSWVKKFLRKEYFSRYLACYLHLVLV